MKNCCRKVKKMHTRRWSKICTIERDSRDPENNRRRKSDMDKTGAATVVKAKTDEAAKVVKAKTDEAAKVVKAKTDEAAKVVKAKTDEAAKASKMKKNIKQIFELTSRQKREEYI